MKYVNIQLAPKTFSHIRHKLQENDPNQELSCFTARSNIESLENTVFYFQTFGQPCTFFLPSTCATVAVLFIFVKAFSMPVKSLPSAGLILKSVLNTSTACLYFFAFSKALPRYWRLGSSQSR